MTSLPFFYCGNIFPLPRSLAAGQFIFWKQQLLEDNAKCHKEYSKKTFAHYCGIIVHNRLLELQIYVQIYDN